MITRETARFILQNSRWGFLIPPGPDCKNIRREIMQRLTDEKLPLAKCGINAVEKALYQALEIGRSCIAQMEKEALRKLQEIEETTQ